MKLLFSSTWLLLPVATPSVVVVAKKEKKTTNIKNKDPGARDRNLNCDPLQEDLREDNGCKNWDCASINWEDGCEACMCYNMGNDSWCDGKRSAYYDNYYKENGKNPFGDSNQRNRKCNTQFSPKRGPCQNEWECDSSREPLMCWNCNGRDSQYGCCLRI